MPNISRMSDKFEIAIITKMLSWMKSLNSWGKGIIITQLEIICLLAY